MAQPEYIQNIDNAIKSFPNLFPDIQCNTMEVTNAATLEGSTIETWQDAQGFNSGFFTVTENQTNTTGTAYYRIIGTTPGSMIAFLNITGISFNWVSNPVNITGLPNFLIPTTQNETTISIYNLYYVDSVEYQYANPATILSTGVINLPNIDDFYYATEFNPANFGNFMFVYFL